MTAAILRTEGMRRILSLGVFLYAIYGAFAQSVTAPAFEVVSIKPNTTGKEGGSIGRRGDTFDAAIGPLRALLSYAYGPPNGYPQKPQIIAAPEWVNTDRFEVQAKLPSTHRCAREDEPMPNRAVAGDERGASASRW